MKKRIVRLLPVLALLVFPAIAARADQFSDIEHSPYTYWVPAPTPGYPAGPYYYGYYGPGPGYYGPPPGYYLPPAPPPPPAPPVRFFIGFHFH